MRSSNNPESNDFITDTDLQEMGISRDLWEDWYLIMNFLWIGVHETYPQSTMNDNEIIIGNFTISANFIRSSSDSDHVEIELREESGVYFTARYANNPSAIVNSLLGILESLV
jgi:hypothetical protein